MEESYSVQVQDEVGRVLIATRKIEPLEIILTDSPAAVGPHHHSVPVCLQCLRVHEGDFRCPGCSFPMCDQKCSEGSVHKKECSVLAKLANNSNNNNRNSEDDNPNYMVVLAIRLQMLKKENPELWLEIDQLMDHEEARRENSLEWEMFQSEVVEPIKSVMKEEDVSESEIHRLIGIMNINCVGFDMKEVCKKGRALYPLLSLVSHNCVSNARYSVNPEDFSITLRARKRICEGEEITINYIPAIYGRPKRKKLLAEEWYFTCKCARCVDVTEFGTYVSALRCSSCMQGLILPEKPEAEDPLWRCRDCLNPYEHNFISEFVESCEEELLEITRKSPTLKTYESFMKKHSTDLYSKHYLNLIAQRNIIHLLSSDPKSSREAHKKIVRYAKNFIFIMNRLDPGYSEWKGTIQKKLNKAQLALLKLDLQERKVDRNTFTEKSELVWSSMQEVEKCELLCTPSAPHISKIQTAPE